MSLVQGVSHDGIKTLFYRFLTVLFIKYSCKIVMHGHFKEFKDFAPAAKLG